MRTSNNTVLITGGASGIGFSLAKTFLEKGNQVIIIGRNSEKLKLAQSQYPALITYSCDISNRSERDDLILEIEKKHKELNILVNNAGVQVNYPSIEDISSIQHIRPELNINLVAPIELTCLLLPILLQKETACIVNITSVLGIVPKKNAPIYCASKSGLHTFSQSLRYQLENTGVKLFEVIPPLVDTDMTQGRGEGKISPETLVEEFFAGFEKDRYEMNIGKTKILRKLHRLFPKLAENIIKNKE